MNRANREFVLRSHRMPHMRGDEPAIDAKAKQGDEYAPHAWG